MKWLLILALTANVWASTHYISTSTTGASDSNNGTATTTPWLHLPGMPGCTANCAAYTPVAGDNFILKGGDTWGSANAALNWNWSGTSGSRIYIGVDKTWFAGASWARPIFNCQNTACPSSGGSAIIWLGGSYTTMDNIEFTGFRQCVSSDGNCANSNGQTIVGLYNHNNEISNWYVHGLTRTSGGGAYWSDVFSANWSGGDGIQDNFHDNIIDESDSSNPGKGDFLVGILHGYEVYNNVIRYVYDGMNGSFYSIHGNLMEHEGITSPSGDHCNVIYPQDIFPGAGNRLYVYNNIIRLTDGGGAANGLGPCGGSLLFTLGNTYNASEGAYVFNNVMYDNSYGFDPGITIGSNGATGTYYVYNNTIEPIGASGECMRSGNSAASSTTHYANNHCISSAAICSGPGTTCVNDGGNLAQTLAQANSAGYTDAQALAFSPTTANSPTVGTGNTATSGSTFCNGLADATAKAACLRDTTYPSYDTTNHVVVMRTAKQRSASGNWDIGAYQFAAPQPTILQYASDFQFIFATSNNQYMRTYLPNPAGAGNLITVLVPGDPTNAPTVSDDKSDTYHSCGTASNGGQIWCFYAYNVTAGARVITTTAHCASGVCSNYSTPTIAEWTNVLNTADPLEATGTGSSASGTLTASAVTPAAAGDLVIQYSLDTNECCFGSAGSTSGTVWAADAATPQAGTTWRLWAAENEVAEAAQWTVYTQNTALSATMRETATPAGAGGATLAAFFKPCTTSCGTAQPAGIRVTGRKTVNYLSQPPFNFSATRISQFPCSADSNLMVFNYASGGTDLLSVSTPGITWTAIPAVNGGTPFEHNYYAANLNLSATAPPNVTTVLQNPPNSESAEVYCVKGAATAPFDKQQANATGNQTVAGNLDLLQTSPPTSDTITPSTANGLIFVEGSQEANTSTGLVGANQLWDGCIYSAESVSVAGCSQNNPFGHYYNPDTTAVSFLATQLQAGLAVAGYVGEADAFKAPGGPANNPSFSYAPAPIAFGNVNLGSTGGPITVTITNSGTAALTLGAIGPPSDTQFVMASDNCSNRSVASGGGTCTFQIRFTPTATGLQSASIGVPDNAGNPDTISVNGTGVNPSAINVIPKAACGPITFPGTCTIAATTAGNVIVVAFSSYNSAGAACPGGVAGCAMTSVTDSGGNTYNEAPNTQTSNTAAGQTSWSDIWWSKTTSAATTVTVTPNTSGTGDVFIWELSNVSVINTSGGLSSQSATATPASPTLTTTTANTAIIASLHPQASSTVSGIDASNSFINDSSNDGMAWAHLVVSSANSYSALWDTTTSVTYQSAAVAFSANVVQLPTGKGKGKWKLSGQASIQ